VCSHTLSDRSITTEASSANPEAGTANERSPFRSTADARRSIITSRAVSVFARGGYRATPITDVAEAAGISPAYVFRLFDSELGLFLAALEQCHERILTTVGEVADPDGPTTSPRSCSRRWGMRTHN
jgi:AcrR family transcriptional regulator